MSSLWPEPIDPVNDETFFDQQIIIDFPEEYVNMVNTYDDLIDYYDNTDLPEKYFDENGVNSVRPLDIDDAESGMYADEVTRLKRLAVCRSCPFYYEPAKACLKCACFIGIYTWMNDPGCPEHKWEE